MIGISYANNKFNNIYDRMMKLIANKKKDENSLAQW